MVETGILPLQNRCNMEVTPPKRIVYVNASVTKSMGIECSRCGSVEVHAEIYLNRFRIELCMDCGYSSRKFESLPIVSKGSECKK